MASGKQSPQLACLVRRCAANLLDNYAPMKLLGQVKPVLVEPHERRVVNQGFPKAKKQMLLQTIDMFSFLGSCQETAR